jgi:hypothetical protein
MMLSFGRMLGTVYRVDTGRALWARPPVVEPAGLAEVSRVKGAPKARPA